MTPRRSGNSSVPTPACSLGQVVATITMISATTESNEMAHGTIGTHLERSTGVGRLAIFFAPAAASARASA